MKYLIYLASGSARRFGENKLLKSVGGKPLFLHGLEQLQKAAAGEEDCEIIAVSRYTEIRRAAEAMGIRTADSPDSEKGLSYTVKAGLNAVPFLKEEDFLIFAAADQPYMRAKSVKKLLACARPDTETARLFYGNRPGNPVLFSAKLADELRALEGDAGGGSVVKHHACIAVQAEDPAELSDIDTPKDLQRKAAVTGRRGAGKTTLVHRFLEESDAEYAGFRTVRVGETDAGPIYAMEEIGSGRRQNISEQKDGRICGIPEVFETFGAEVVKNAVNGSAPLLVFDEIGRFERESPSFLAALEEAFQCGKSVLAVLKKEEIEHIRRIRARADVCTVDLDEVPRERAFALLKQEFAPLLREKPRETGKE